MDIMLWALEQNDPEGWLVPESGSLAEMLDLIAQCDGDFKFNLDHYKYPERYPDGHELSIYRLSASGFLMLLEQRLEKNAYLFGKQVALADMAIAPFIRQFAHTDKAWFADQPWPRTSLVGSNTKLALRNAMTRYAPWQEGQVRWFPPQLENLAGTRLT